MIRHADRTFKLLENRFLADGRLDVSTPDPMTAFGTDVVSRGDLDLLIGASRTPKRAQLSGHPHRPRRGAGSLRASVRFVGCERSFHLPATSRAAASPAEQGADAGPQLDERPRLPLEPTVLRHDETSVRNPRPKDHTGCLKVASASSLAVVAPCPSMNARKSLTKRRSPRKQHRLPSDPCPVVTTLVSHGPRACRIEYTIEDN